MIDILFMIDLRKQESRDLEFEAMFCHQCDDSLAGHRFVWYHGDHGDHGDHCDHCEDKVEDHDEDPADAMR